MGIEKYVSKIEKVVKVYLPMAFASAFITLAYGCSKKKAIEEMKEAINYTVCPKAIEFSPEMKEAINYTVCPNAEDTEFIEDGVICKYRDKKVIKKVVCENNSCKLIQVKEK